MRVTGDEEQQVSGSSGKGLCVLEIGSPNYRPQERICSLIDCNVSPYFLFTLFFIPSLTLKVVLLPLNH